jgi:hypothetical protein
MQTIQNSQSREPSSLEAGTAAKLSVPHSTHQTHNNNNTKTVLCNWPPTEFLPKQTPPTKAIANIYELKRNLSLSATTIQWWDSPPIQHVSRQSKTGNLHHGWASQHNQSPSIFWSRKRLYKDMVVRHKAASTPLRLQQVMKCTVTKVTMTRHQTSPTTTPNH